MFSRTPRLFSIVMTSSIYLGRKGAQVLNNGLGRGNQFVDLFGEDQNAFRCIKWAKLTDYSYVYYIYASYEAQVSQTCCTPFLITAAYTHNDGSTITCGTGSLWDVCSDRTQMAVNLTQCSTKQFYSAGGKGVCVYSTSSGSTYYQTVLNTDTSVDYSTTYRLTCYLIFKRLEVFDKRNNMVEGPGCKIKGEKIRAKLKGQAVKKVSGNAVSKEIKPSKGIDTSQFEVLIGRKLDEVQTLGKELFMYFGDLCLRVHFLMAGSFRVNDQQLDNDYGKLTETPSLEITMTTDVLKFYKSAVDVRSAESCRTRYEELNDVDICSPKFNYRRAAELVKGEGERQVCDVLLDQTILPGVGNIIKNEALFDSGIKPSSKVKELSNELVSLLIKMTRDFTMIFYKCRSTGTSLNKYMKVYKKGKCSQCQGKITQTRMGDDSERVTYFCPACQTNTIRIKNQQNSLLGWVQHAGTKVEDWACTACTLINKGSNSVCEACLSPKSVLTEDLTKSSAMKRKPEDCIQPSNIKRSRSHGMLSGSPVDVYARGTRTKEEGPKNSVSHEQSQYNKPTSLSNGKFQQVKAPKGRTPHNALPVKTSNVAQQGKNTKSATREQDSLCNDSKIPFCPGHKVRCKIAQTRKEGNNFLRWFFTCALQPRTKQCKYFKWADEDFPICPGHGKPAAFRTVMKQGPNNGRKFFACSLPKQKQCEFFEWAIGYDSLML
ncbi:hypothetical protein FSP39_019030 [Pinctada imbricata]|uniref:Endonuclease 8-like 3 n=1 Tax=Pinctada imbricata TaxID=66713 RepID=A0AA88Y960_PINIB|nr:hypothetical protein FSP39_019030 [Pinctada imbricata]